MDIEAVQFLNLSPIPELSELELSTMLEQLSGLSDLNGDLTDRNVEDILKEAEDLIDRSSSKRPDKSKAESKNFKENSQALDQENLDEELYSVNQEYDKPIKITNKMEEPDLVETKHDSSLRNNNNSKHYNSPVEQEPKKAYSPGGSMNLIKSTIDSLKEYSNLMEKQFSDKVQHSPPKSNREMIKNKKDCKTKEINSGQSEKSTSSPKSITGEIVKPFQKKKTKQFFTEKSTRLLNCFERLYLDRPVRLSVNHKKPKTADKIPKTIVNTKHVKDFKKPANMFSLKEKKQIKSFVCKKIEDSHKSAREIIVPTLDLNSPKTHSPEKVGIDIWMQEEHKNSSKLGCESRLCSQAFSEVDSDNESILNYLKLNQRLTASGGETDGTSKSAHTKIDENLIRKLLHEMEEIKVQMKKAGVVAECTEKSKEEKQAVVEDLKSEVEAVRQEVACESMKSAGIQRLEQQFSMLKDKYDQQLEKMEAENLKLKEALNNQQRYYTSQVVGQNEISNVGGGGDFNSNNLLVPITPSSVPERETNLKPSLENTRAPKSSPPSTVHSSPECRVSSELQTSSTLKEAYSQTEKEQRNMSVQCVEEEEVENVMKNRKPGAVEVKTDFVFGARRIENKENVSLKRKSANWRLFSDVNVQQAMRQKRMYSEHETQLLATLRGLQAELSLKDKETRKMKAEIDLLKIQIKRLTKNKIEGVKKCHMGTQTIGLGPVASRSYNPEIYQDPDNKYEKENEELKSKITTLEENFELLKEKRINDLQSLHQVHEEEITKLVSKLETQKALTKHLHSLLVHR